MCYVQIGFPLSPEAGWTLEAMAGDLTYLSSTWDVSALQTAGHLPPPCPGLPLSPAQTLTTRVADRSDPGVEGGAGGTVTLTSLWGSTVLSTLSLSPTALQGAGPDTPCFA